MAKILSTIRALACMGMARHFGRYLHSTGGMGEPDCAIYEWRGARWCIPLSSIQDELP